MDIISPIANVVVQTVNGLNVITGNYGLSLILLAAIVKLALYRPTQAMYESQKKMERLKPLMDKIKEDFKDDEERQQKEMLKLYTQEGFNPLGGCLPLFIQMPIFIAIWRALMSQPEVLGKSYFLWIRPGAIQALMPGLFASNLAEPDLALILFYGVMMILSQQLTPSTGDATQRQVGLFMSAFFTYMVWQYSWPCALVLYWSTFQFLSILQNMVTFRPTVSKKKS